MYCADMYTVMYTLHLVHLVFHIGCTVQCGLFPWVPGTLTLWVL